MPSSDSHGGTEARRIESFGPSVPPCLCVTFPMTSDSLNSADFAADGIVIDRAALLLSPYCGPAATGRPSPIYGIHRHDHSAVGICPLAISSKLSPRRIRSGANGRWPVQLPQVPGGTPNRG